MSRTSLAAGGFEVTRAGELGIDSALLRYLDPIQADCQELQPDPYAAGSNRFRAYGRAVLLPWTGTLTWLPTEEIDGKRVSRFYNGDFNREVGKQWRFFPALRPECMTNPLVENLIRRDAATIPCDERFCDLPLYIGVALVRMMVPSGGSLAVSTPNCLHQDGESFTFVHLISRTNQAGGDNVIAEPSAAGMLPGDIERKRILARFELLEPLDTYSVCDERVSHYVAPLRAEDPSMPAERSVFLIDFTPMLPIHYFGAPAVHK